MQAIGNKIKTTNPELNVVFVTSEQFLNDFSEHILKNDMPNFRKKYRTADLLLLDDIQFFQDKEGLQTEFFNTYNTLYGSKKQIVFTCDKPPSELKKLDERLKSRFESGLNIDIHPPTYETRLAILRKNIESRNITIQPEVLDLIAKNVSSNVRDLKASLTKIVAYIELTKKEITVDLAISLLRDTFGNPSQKNTTMDTILRVIANYFSITVADIRGKSRKSLISYARQLVMYIAKDMTEMSTTEIGQEIGFRDHATVIHGINKIKQKKVSDSTIEDNITHIKNKIKEETK